MEKVKKMREEIAGLEGRSVEDVEEEAQVKARTKRQLEETKAAERKQSLERKKDAVKDNKKMGASFLSVPETFEDQVEQASRAVQRAFQDGLTRQTVRFALLREGEFLSQEDRLWPGGPQQMYREAAGPLATSLLQSVGTSPDFRRPNVTAQDLFDFDGSALLTAEAPSGPQDDVQALVFANTDNKYARDIREIDNAMKERLFLLVNPFWRNLESWGFNILAPKAKELAQEAIFDKGFDETYVLLQTSVRGEDCIALKAYPYDWQLYVYIENDYWPYDETIMHLGSTPKEPTTAEFAALINERDEFKMSKNMRQMQRRMNQ